MTTPKKRAAAENAVIEDDAVDQQESLTSVDPQVVYAMAEVAEAGATAGGEEPPATEQRVAGRVPVVIRNTVDVTDENGHRLYFSPGTLVYVSSQQADLLRSINAID